MLSLSFALAQEKEKTKLLNEKETGFVEVEKQAHPLTPISPAYPQLAQLAGIEGKVFLKILVDENGNAEKIEVLKSDSETLDGAAIDAVKKTKFSPAIADNKPIKTWIVIPLLFKLTADKQNAPIVSPGVKAPSSINDPDINESVQVEKYPEMIESANPEYPEIAKRAGITGKVFVKVLVDKEGTPKKAIVIKSENELFNQSAFNAAMKTKFTPAMQGGKPIAVWIVLPYKFSLDGEPQKGEIKTFDTVDKAMKEFKSNIYMFENAEAREAIGSPKNMKFEKAAEQIQYGDESTLYRVANADKIGFMFVARKGNKFLKYGAKSIEEIHKYVEELKKDEK